MIEFRSVFPILQRMGIIYQKFDMEDITNTKLGLSYEEHQTYSISKLKVLLYSESLRRFKTNYFLLSKIKEGMQNHITASL